MQTWAEKFEKERRLPSCCSIGTIKCNYFLHFVQSKTISEIFLVIWSHLQFISAIWLNTAKYNHQAWIAAMTSIAQIALCYSKFAFELHRLNVHKQFILIILIFDHFKRFDFEFALKIYKKTRSLIKLLSRDIFLFFYWYFHRTIANDKSPKTHRFKYWPT